MIWTNGTDKLDEFINFLNKQRPIIQFTADDGDHYEISLLDVFSFIKNGHISTDLYFKPTDTYQYW